MSREKWRFEGRATHPIYGDYWLWRCVSHAGRKWAAPVPPRKVFTENGSGENDPNPKSWQREVVEPWHGKVNGSA